MKRDKQSFGEYLEALLCKRNYPGMAVCIRGPEGVLFDRGFGYRSIEHHKKADTNTIFGIASMSKSMTALACCILQTEGKMNLDDPVVQYFPDFHIPGSGRRVCYCQNISHAQGWNSADGAVGMVNCYEQY